MAGKEMIVVILLVLFTRKVRTFRTQNVAHFVGGTEDAIGSSRVFAAQFIFSTFTGITLKTCVNKTKLEIRLQRYYLFHMLLNPRLSRSACSRKLYKLNMKP